MLYIYINHINNNIMDDKSILRNKIVDAIIMKKLPPDVCISTMTICCELDIEFRVNNIANYIDLDKDSIINISYGRNDDPSTNRSLFPRKKSKKKKKGKRVFYNQVSLNVMVESKKEKPINIKLFTNGSIQMTGCKSVENVIDVLSKIFNELKVVKAVIDLKQMKMVDKSFINDNKKLFLKYVDNIVIGMINSNFRYPNKIDRLKLYNQLNIDNIASKYDPSNHACVNIKYHCTDKTISIFVFEKGPIVITGAKNCEHILAGYTFINKYLLTNHFKIAKSTVNVSDINNMISDETHDKKSKKNKKNKDELFEKSDDILSELGLYESDIDSDDSDIQIKNKSKSKSKSKKETKKNKYKKKINLSNDSNNSDDSDDSDDSNDSDNEINEALRILTS
jgi:TATA-box binding protein (TBP) (component of TFIID and TFIIIB)